LHTVRLFPRHNGLVTAHILLYRDAAQNRKTSKSENIYPHRRLYALQSRWNSETYSMKIRVGFELVYEFAQTTPMVLMLNVHPSRAADLVEPDRLRASPALPLARYLDGFGNICTRLTAPQGQITIRTDAVVADSGVPDPVEPAARQHDVNELPHDALVFLLASRYCETEHLMSFAWSNFAATAPGWPRVQAICDFVHSHLRFGYPHAQATRTAMGAFVDRRGVCRDFAHLAVTLCRCMNIPARYCTGYLGDIGVPPDPEPMDFSAWFEVYLDGRWHTFDARYNRPRIGRIVMARGRDAADVAISTTFGPNTLKRFTVVTDEMVDEPAYMHERMVA
jgi:transglutaminase-like putative cysteine protease